MRTCTITGDDTISLQDVREIDSGSWNDFKSANTTYAARDQSKERVLQGDSNGIEKEQADKFLVEYRNRLYDIRDFLRYHPGGRKVLGYLKNRSLDKPFNQVPHSKSAFYLLEEFTLDEERKDDEREDCVDWNKPLLKQVGLLAEKYWDWMNLPVNRPIRLFQSDLLEWLTVTPWYLVPLVWFPTCVYFFYAGCITVINDYDGAGTILKVPIAYVAGLLLWTILEYVLHRQLFHFRPPEDSKILITFHFLLHGVHHKAPFDGRRLLFPPIAGLIVAGLVWRIYKILFPLSVVHFIAAGTTTGYLFYDLTHYYLHHGAPKVGSYMYTMKRSHNYHHFSHHDQGFGISSRLWDRAFGTDVSLRQLPKPIEW